MLESGSTDQREADGQEGRNAATPSPKPPRLRWLRFGLRTLFVLVLAIGVGLGWFAAKLRRARLQRNAAIAVVSLNGTVDYGKNFRLESWGRLPLGPPPTSHAWLRKRFGDDLFDSVTGVVFFRQAGVTDADMALLDAFPDLEGLHISKAPVADLSHLAHLRSLQRVMLSEIPISDASLTSIASLPKLTHVNLSRTRIGDAGLAILGTMPQLRSLDLQWTRVTDAGLIHLSGLNRIEWLQLDCTEITDSGLDHLRGLLSLKYLSIAATRVTPDGKSSIEAALPNSNVTWWLRHGDLSQGGPEIPEPQPASNSDRRASLPKPL
jgi:hypothetical protein